jgi:UDP-N-acetylglucosamine:LPS N-acetylglucosamine transferase
MTPSPEPPAVARAAALPPRPAARPGTLPPRPAEPIDVLFVASTGGHLNQLNELARFFGATRSHWVTFDKPYANVLLGGQPITFAHYPTVRNPRNLARNLLLAVRVQRRLRPRAVVTTGSGVGVPFLYAARLLGMRAIFVESLARSEQLSLSARLVLPVCTDLFVQWPNLTERYRKARYAGALL